MRIFNNSNLMISTSLIALSLSLTSCPGYAIVLKDTFDVATHISIPIIKHQSQYQISNYILSELKEVKVPQSQIHLKVVPTIESPKNNSNKQIDSYGLTQALNPTYRLKLFNIANEINPSVLTRALGFSNNETKEPTQAFGDIIRFQDSFDNGNTWRDVFADSGR